MIKLYTDICSTWISRTSAKKTFHIDWHHKYLKNKIYILLLFYKEHVYGFSESIILYILLRFVLSLKNSHYVYISLHMHKTLPTLENEK